MIMGFALIMIYHITSWLAQAPNVRTKPGPPPAETLHGLRPRQNNGGPRGRRHTTVSCHTRLLCTECRPEHRNSESACPPGQPERFTEKRTLCQYHLAIRQRIAGNTDTGRVHRYRSIGKICVCSERFRYGALSPHRGGTVDRRQSAANNRRTLATGTLRHPGTDESAGRDESKAHQQITNRK